MRHPLWRPEALEDLREIGRYIARDNPAAARQWVARMRAAAVEAANMPRMGRCVPELGREDVREVLLRTWRVAYRVEDSAVEVLAVFSGRRPLDERLRERLDVD